MVVATTDENVNGVVLDFKFFSQPKQFDSSPLHSRPTQLLEVIFQFVEIIFCHRFCLRPLRRPIFRLRILFWYVNLLIYHLWVVTYSIFFRQHQMFFVCISPRNDDRKFTHDNYGNKTYIFQGGRLQFVVILSILNFFVLF